MEMIVRDALATVELKEKAMFRAAKMLEEMNLTRATKKMFLKFACAFPQSPRIHQLRTVDATV